MLPDLPNARLLVKVRPEAVHPSPLTPTSILSMQNYQLTSNYRGHAPIQRMSWGVVRPLARTFRAEIGDTVAERGRAP